MVQGQITALKTLRDFGIRIQIDLNEANSELIAQMVDWTNKEFLTLYLKPEEE